MELSSHMGSDRTWMWSVQADFADETAKEELLAIRFANPESKFLFHCVIPSLPSYFGIFENYEGK